MQEQRLKVAAYGICWREECLLLARYVDPRSGQKWWTLPGGKLEHGEDPIVAVRREAREETGYEVRVSKLLGVGSRLHDVDWGIPGGAELHSVGIYYEAMVMGGVATAETGGSTDETCWMPRTQLHDIDRSVILDLGLDLHSRLPEDGHPEPISVTGRLRN